MGQKRISSFLMRFLKREPLSGFVGTCTQSQKLGSIIGFQMTFKSDGLGMSLKETERFTGVTL